MVPLRIPFLLAATAAVLIHRRIAKTKPGTCRTCRYDLTGNTSGVCPECGTKFDLKPPEMGVANSPQQGDGA